MEGIGLKKDIRVMDNAEFIEILLRYRGVNN